MKTGKGSTQFILQAMSREQQFWDWFKVNEAKYFSLNQITDDYEKERLLDDLLSHLHEYCDQLFFEVGGYPDEKQDLIITAEGDTSFLMRLKLWLNMLLN